MAAENLSVPERSEIAAHDKWDLEAIYKTFDEWENAFNKVSLNIKVRRRQRRKFIKIFKS